MQRRYSLVFVVLLCALPGPEVCLRATPVAHAANAGAPPPVARAPSSDFIMSLQRELKRAGYDPGAADGKMGPMTRRALERFQQAQGLSPTGDADIPTLTRLLRKDLEP
jgi:peptidoglycan hydrolase-like protein with peptidoglycan-binding domain